MPGVGTNRYSYSANDPVNQMDPSGNEVYKDEDDWSEKELETVQEDFKAARKQLGRLIDRLQVAIDRLASGKKIWGYNIPNMKNIAQANGVSVENVTIDMVRQTQADARAGLDAIGALGEASSLHVNRSPGEPGTTATAGRNTNAINIHDGYFEHDGKPRTQANRTRTLVHETGHAAFDRTDQLGLKSNSQLTLGPNVRVYGKKVLGYRWPGIDLANQLGISNFNDRVTCAMGFC